MRRRLSGGSEYRYSPSKHGGGVDEEGGTLAVALALAVQGGAPSACATCASVAVAVAAVVNGVEHSLSVVVFTANYYQPND